MHMSMTDSESLHNVSSRESSPASFEVCLRYLHITDRTRQRCCWGWPAPHRLCASQRAPGDLAVAACKMVRQHRCLHIVSTVCCQEAGGGCVHEC